MLTNCADCTGVFPVSVLTETEDGGCCSSCTERRAQWSEPYTAADRARDVEAERFHKEIAGWGCE